MRCRYPYESRQQMCPLVNYSTFPKNRIEWLIIFPWDKTTYYTILRSKSTYLAVSWRLCRDEKGRACTCFIISSSRPWKVNEFYIKKNSKMAIDEVLQLKINGYVVYHIWKVVGRTRPATPTYTQWSRDGFHVEPTYIRSIGLRRSKTGWSQIDAATRKKM